MRSIVWPEGYLPGKTDNFVSNEVIVSKLTSTEVWAALINTSLWPTYYDNISDIQLHSHQGAQLSAGCRFSFTTFGYRIEAEVMEYAAPSEGQSARIAWHGWTDTNDLKDRIDVHHAWLIEDLSCERVRILTQETQNGEPAKALANTTPNPMLNGHQTWLDGLSRTALQHQLTP